MILLKYVGYQTLRLRTVGGILDFQALLVKGHNPNGLIGY